MGNSQLALIPVKAGRKYQWAIFKLLFEHFYYSDQHSAADFGEQVHRADRDERRGILHTMETPLPSNSGQWPLQQCCGSGSHGWCGSRALGWYGCSIWMMRIRITWMMRVKHLEDSGPRAPGFIRIQYLDETDPDHLNYADPALGWRGSGILGWCGSGLLELPKEKHYLYKGWIIKIQSYSLESRSFVPTETDFW